MEKKIRKSKKNKGVTLIALVVTIIVLLILAGVTILALTGENGILGKAGTAKEETNEKQATEIMNLKITNAQIKSYSETQEMPTLQYLANRLCEDIDMEYVELVSQNKNTASTDETFLPLINVPEKGSIFTKLKEYPYEFEIDENLRLASVNGVKVAENDKSYDELLQRINTLEATVQGQAQKINSQEQEINTLKNETIVNKRINLMNSPVDIPLSTTGVDVNKDVTLKGSIEDYKYIEIQVDVHWTGATTGNHIENTVLIAREQLNYNNSNTVNWGNESTFDIKSTFFGGRDYVGTTAWFKDNKTLHLGLTETNRVDFDKLRIRNIYGIK